MRTHALHRASLSELNRTMRSSAGITKTVGFLATQFSGNERHDLLERAVTDAFAIRFLNILAMQT